MLLDDIDTATKKLAEREGIRIENITKYIAHLNVNGPYEGEDSKHYWKMGLNPWP